MSIEGIGRNAYRVQAEMKIEKKAEVSPKKEEKIEGKQDTFVRSYEESSGIYSADAIKAHKLSDDALELLKDERVTAFQNMLQKMLLQQGEQVTENAVKVHMFGRDFAVTPEDSAKAAAEISEDGYWGVDAVAGRIMDMAKGLAAGDPARFQMLKDAVMQGFSEAQKVWGDEEMPDITSETYDEVMERFDAWKEELGLSEPEDD